MQNIIVKLVHTIFKKNCKKVAGVYVSDCIILLLT